MVYELPDQSLFVDVSDPQVACDTAGVAITGGIHIDLSQLQEMYGADIKNLLNVQQPATADKDAVAAAWEPIRLCVSEPRMKESPTLCHASLCPMSSGTLRFERTGQRTILLPRKRASLGRARDNDIVLRFLPRSSSFDTMSRNISRKHMEFELVDSGLVLLSCKKITWYNESSFDSSD
ncbi:MAG: FHA domain-containing protein [Candidatus Cloacimonadales bacterium]